MTILSSLNPYQYAFNGFIFGAGTPYTVNSVSGLMGTPSIRANDLNQGYNDNSFSGRDFYEGRVVTFDITVFGDSVNTV